MSNMSLSTLYKKTELDQVQVWWMEIDGSRYRTHSGKQGGKIVTSGWTDCRAKNVGKANEVSAEDQAWSEVRSKYTDKRKRGYHDTVEDIVKGKSFFPPMLAETYDYKLVAGKTVYSQPKLDGIRCLAQKDRLQSRSGKEDWTVTCPHIAEILKPLFAVYPDLVLDGELYNHDLHDDFPKICSLIKKKKPTFIDIAETAEKVQFWIYDMYDPNDAEATFDERNMDLKYILADTIDSPSIVFVPTTTIHPLKPATKEYIEETLARYIEAGYEGQIIRLGTQYENKRTKALLKHKEFETAEFEISSVNEGEGNRSGMAGNVTCRFGNSTFNASIKGTHDYCRQLLRDADKYADGIVTLKFFGYYPDGAPRFPVAVMLYEGKDRGE